MNRYRTYMDRVHAPAGLGPRILDDAAAGKKPRRAAPRRALIGGLAAACFALACFGSWQYWRAANLGPDPTAGVAATPAPVETGPALDERGYVLVVEDPFEGQNHSFYRVAGLTFPDCTGGYAVSGSIVPPAGYFAEYLTAEEIIAVLGGTDEVPWPLLWSGFGLSGEAVYDGEGNVWRAVIYGDSGETSFTLILAPGDIPVSDMMYEDAVTEEYDGTGVSVTSWRTAGEGRETYGAEFMSGDTGVSFTCTGPEGDSLSWLTCVLVRYGTLAEPTFTTAPLTPDAIPEWRSEALTLEEARREKLGGWLPLEGTIPGGFAFDSARVELGQGRDYLSAYWYKGYDYIDVTVYRQTEGGYFPEADLRADQVTAEALEALGDYVDDDAGDTPGWRWLSLTVAFTDDVRVKYSLKGVTPEQAADLITGGGQIKEYNWDITYVEPGTTLGTSSTTIP